MLGRKLEDRHKRLHEELHRFLMEQWDSIGVAEWPEAHDEYDGYVWQIMGLLLRDAPVHEISEYLWWIETEYMGLGDNPSVRANTDRIAVLLIELRRQVADT